MKTTLYDMQKVVWVWQSWRYLDRSYDMSAGFQVFPVEIANSMQTKLVADYSNK